MSLIQEQQIQPEIVQEKVQHLASDIFLHATETQCSFFRGIEIKGQKKYCALGLLGLYSVGDPDCNNHHIEEKFNMSLNEETNCPACDYVSRRGNVIVHLNNISTPMIKDNHGWSFQQIGEWLQEEGY